MKNNIIITGGTILLAATVIFHACEKDESETLSTESSIVEDDAFSEGLFEDVFNETDEIINNQLYGLKAEQADTCKTVTMERIDSVTREITVDYGEGNCEGRHGRVRKGKIIITTSGRYRKEGFIRTITFENYFINDFQIEGTKTVTNMGFDSTQHMIYSVTLENGKITTPGGKEITREYERTREWIEGFETPRYVWDDGYLITGIATGTNRRGVNFTRTITTPLYITTTCRFILSGIVEIEREDKPLITVDYGDGECDNLATLTVNGETKEIRLRR